MRLAIPTVLLLLVFGCSKIEKLPPEPLIDYRSFVVFDTTDALGNEAKGGRLTFYFEDGDGDLGLQQPQPGETDTSNFFLTLYRKTNGVYSLAEPSDPLYPSRYRIPFMDREGQNKILKGRIEVTFFYLFWEPTDTFKYDFYLVDRAGNESNVSTTEEIYFGTAETEEN